MELELERELRIRGRGHLTLTLCDVTTICDEPLSPGSLILPQNNLLYYFIYSTKLIVSHTLNATGKALFYEQVLPLSNEWNNKIYHE